jgi:hypothetical protein
MVFLYDPAIVIIPVKRTSLKLLPIKILKPIRISTCHMSMVFLFWWKVEVSRLLTMLFSIHILVTPFQVVLPSRIKNPTMKPALLV